MLPGAVLKLEEDLFIFPNLYLKMEGANSLVIGLLETKYLTVISDGGFQDWNAFSQRNCVQKSLVSDVMETRYVIYVIISHLSVKYSFFHVL